MTPPQVRAALTALYAAQGWPGEGHVVTGRTVEALQRTLGELRGPRLAIGIVDNDVVVAAHHSGVDGLGLLAVLSAVAGVPVSSSAHGVGERSTAGTALGGAVRRLVEVGVTPPARIAAPGGDGGVPGDVFVDRTVAGVRRTAELVHAAARGVVAHNRAAGRPVKHVAVAVGLSRVGGGGSRIADHSALLRLRDVERLGPDEIGELLRSAPTQPAVPGAGAGRGASLVQLGLKALAPRLGSTLLVSHLGALTAPDVEHAAFHPVTAGGSGVSLGALSLRDRTVLTLRARGAEWTEPGLEGLLEAVVEELAPPW